MDNDKPRCGTHVELSKTPSARITRCSCGKVHIHLLHSGVSFQVTAEQFGEIAEATREATEAIDGRDGANDATVGRAIIN